MARKIVPEPTMIVRGYVTRDVTQPLMIMNVARGPTVGTDVDSMLAEVILRLASCWGV